jgi:hypothetical protein
MSPKVFITAELTLPEPLENHSWLVKNLVKIKKGKTKYITQVFLLDENETIVLVHYEKWDREVTLLNDFLAVITDEVIRKLDDYVNFQTIEWSEDNSNFVRDNLGATQVSETKTIIETEWR